MRIKKKQSLSKIPEKTLSVTATESFYPRERLAPLDDKRDKQPLPREPRLPPIRRNLRNASSKAIEPLEPRRETETHRGAEIREFEGRKETETTLNESSMMFQSMYGKEWLRPSDYAREIRELNLLGGSGEVAALEINLGDRVERNMERVQRLKEVIEKWVQVLKKATSYLHSTRAASDKLIEEVKFWKALSRKFDELEYEFNDTRAGAIMESLKIFRTEPKFRALYEEFISLKENIIRLTPAVKKLYLQLQEAVSGFILRLEQCSDVRESAQLLRKILLGFEAAAQENELLRSRETVIFEKIEGGMAQKLLATSLYPRQLANISSVRENYQVIDRALSFYSQLLASLEDANQDAALVQRTEHVRMVLANLLQILSYFQHLYHTREVNEFSKLFSHPLDFNIYDPEYASLWNQYMELVTASMDAHHFEA